MHTVLRCSADACLLVPIFADHVGGLHVAMPFEWCVQSFPSSHVGPLATAGNKRWLREGTAKEETVAWEEQFPRGGGLSDACYVLYMCRRAFAGEPRVSVEFIASSSTSASRLDRQLYSDILRPRLCDIQPTHQLLVLRHTR
jgi:hypothetical protein